MSERANKNVEMRLQSKTQFSIIQKLQKYSGTKNREEQSFHCSYYHKHTLWACGFGSALTEWHSRAVV